MQEPRRIPHWAALVIINCCVVGTSALWFAVLGGYDVAWAAREMADVVPPYTVKTRRCTIHVERSRWDILEYGKPLLSSPDSFATREEAQEYGLKEIHRLTDVARSRT